MYIVVRYELWKPYLRAMMERDMKAVSDGTKTKLEVLETSLRQMRECFLDVSKIFEHSLKEGNHLKLRFCSRSKSLVSKPISLALLTFLLLYMCILC